MTGEDARYLATQRGAWPLWLFLVIVYYFPALYIALTPDPCLGEDHLLARMVIVVWGLLAGIGSAWCIIAPRKAVKLLREEE